MSALNGPDRLTEGQRSNGNPKGYPLTSNVDGPLTVPHGTYDLLRNMTQGVFILSDPRKGRKLAGNTKATGSNAANDYDLDSGFRLFYEAKKAEGMRNRTLADYVSHWRYFREWADVKYPEITLRGITMAVAREYVMYMSSERTKYDGVDNRKLDGVGLSPSTVAIRLRTFRTMFNFWTAEQMMDVNPTSNLKPPRMDEKEKSTFTDNQFLRLLNAPDTNTYAGLRDRVLMLVLADGGFRINEAVGLKTEHLDVKSRCINLPGSMNKNRKPRIVPLSAEVIKAVEALIKENKKYFGEEAAYIFLANYGEPLKTDQVRKRLKEHAEAAGIDGEVQVSPHQFRSYFLTQYLLNGGDIFSAQRIVAHASIQTTRGYVKLSDENIRQQHAQHSPIARMGLSRVGKRRT